MEWETLHCVGEREPEKVAIFLDNSICFTETQRERDKERKTRGQRETMDRRN